jgi:hypothetical protein
MSNRRSKILYALSGLLILAAFLFRRDLSFGPYFAVYDITVVDTLSTFRRGSLKFGEYDFMGGGFTGPAVNIGVSVSIPDTAVQEYGSVAKLDEKYIHVDSEGNQIYDGPTVPDPPRHYVKVPVRSKLPPRWPWQKYNFIFIHFPNDSLQLKIEVLKKSDCSHLDPNAKTAVLGPGPCSW